MELEILSVGPEHASAVHAVTRAIWTGRVSKTSTVFKETPKTVAAQIKSGGAVLVLDGEDVVGSGRFVMVPGPEGDDSRWMEVKRIGLLPDYTGNDIGAEILHVLEKLGRYRGAIGAQLAVRTDQPALVRVYQECGYQLADDVTLTTPNPLAPNPIGMRKWFEPDID